MRHRVLVSILLSLAASSALSAQAALPPTLDQPAGTNLRVRLAGDRDRGWLSGTLQSITYDTLHLSLRAGGDLRVPRTAVTQFQVGEQLETREGFRYGAKRGFIQSLFVDGAILALYAAGPIDGKTAGALLLVSTGGITGYRAYQGLNDPPVIWGERVQVRK